MRTMTGRMSLTLAGALVASVFAMPAMAESPVTDERLINADSEPQNWLWTLQNYSGHRYSRLDQINADNVADLNVAFALPITTAFAGRDGTIIDTSPLVDEGIMYFEDGTGVFYKVDVSSGTAANVVWTADATVEKDVAAQTRGFALLNNMMVKCLRDGRVVAVDRDSGEFLWDVQRMGIEHPGGGGINIESEACTGGTTTMGGYVIVSNGNGDAGTRGWVEALEADTGAEVWRTYAIPGPGEPGHETWEDDHNAWKTGGGGMWTQGTYDPELRMTYWGVANPLPMFDPDYRPGDNLYANSVLALDIDGGGIEWFFQYVANEAWDYDEQGVHFLLNRDVDGVSRPVVAHFARNGYFYQFDRTSGEFLAGDQYVEELTWTAGLDPKTGKPVEYTAGGGVQEYVPETRFRAGEALDGHSPACPTLIGGSRWQYPAYNPDTGIAYGAGNDGCFSLEVVATIPASPDGGFNLEEGGGMFGIDGFDALQQELFDDHGALWAVNVNTGELVGMVSRPYTFEAGVLVTAGGIIMTSTPDGYVQAYSADDLELLWEFSTGTQGNRGAPIAYSVDGTEYIAVLVAGPAQTFAPAQGALDNMPRGAMMYVFSL